MTNIKKIWEAPKGTIYTGMWENPQYHTFLIFDKNGEAYNLGSAGSRQIAKIRERLKDNPFQMDIEKLYSERYEKDYAIIKRIWIINEGGKIEDLTEGIE
jgi:hypothetical protein